MMNRILFLATALAISASACADSASGHNVDPVHLNMEALSGLRLDHQFHPSYELPIRIKSAAADTTFHSWTNVGDKYMLAVIPKGGGAPFIVRRHPIKAKFYHMGRLLTVQEGPEGDQVHHNFVDPVRWSTTLRTQQ